MNTTLLSASSVLTLASILFGQFILSRAVNLDTGSSGWLAWIAFDVSIALTLIGIAAAIRFRRNGVLIGVSGAPAIAALLLYLFLAGCANAPLGEPPLIAGMPFKIGDSLDVVRQALTNDQKLIVKGGERYLEPVGNGLQVHFDESNRAVEVRLLSGTNVTIGGVSAKGPYYRIRGRLGEPDNIERTEYQGVFADTYYLDRDTAITFRRSDDVGGPFSSRIDMAIIRGNLTHRVRDSWPPSSFGVAARLSSAPVRIEGAPIKLGDSLEAVRKATSNDHQLITSGKDRYLEPFGDGIYVYFNESNHVSKLRLLSGATVTVGDVPVHGLYYRIRARLGEPDVRSRGIDTYYLDSQTAISFGYLADAVDPDMTIVGSVVISENPSHQARRAWPTPPPLLKTAITLSPAKPAPSNRGGPDPTSLAPFFASPRFVDASQL